MSLKISFPTVMVAAVVALGVGVTLWNFDEPPATQGQENLVLPRYSTLAMDGNIVFDQNCGGCHGINAIGSDKGPPLLHDIYNPGHHDDESFFRAVRQGTRRHHWNFGDMPPQPEVSRRDVIAIVRYIRELQEANGIVWKRHTM